MNSSLLKPSSFQPRAYQEALAASAIGKGNTLVVLPTGLGKTIIAALVMAHRLSSVKNSKALFLAPTRPLCVQHREALSKLFAFTESEVALLTGMVAKKKRSQLFADARIVCATPQTIASSMEDGSIELGDYSIVVFDEAHRGVKNYSYTSIAEKYSGTGNAYILGLTASPGSSRQRIKEVCDALKIGSVEMRTREDSDVKPYVKDTSVDWVQVELPEEFFDVRRLLGEFIERKTQSLKEMGFLRVAMKKMPRRLAVALQQRVSAEISRHGAKRPALYSAASSIAAILKVQHALELVETQGIAAAKSYAERLEEQARQPGASKAVKSLLKDSSVSLAFAKIKALMERSLEHPKLKRLTELVELEVLQKPNPKILVFTQFRDSATRVVESLNALKGVKAARFVGQASRGEKDAGLSQKEQAQIIQDFKEGKHNVLVATSVGEEGIDIPSVDLVVFYEAVPSEIRAIQRRGRTGRQEAGRVVILVTKKTSDEAYLWSQYRKEKQMVKTITRMKETGLEVGEGREKKLKPGEQARLTDY